MSNLIVESKMVGEIPLLTLNLNTQQRPPVVFFVHGFGADKRQGLSLGYELASRGFYFVALDARMHGERFDPYRDRIVAGQADNVYPTGTGLDTFYLMHQIIAQTGEDIRTLLVHFQEKDSVDMRAVGLTGFSMGGFAAFHILGVNEQVQAAVPIAGVPMFEERWNDVVLESSAYPKWSADIAGAREESERRKEFMREIDPYRNQSAISSRPLLMIQGDLDTDSPKKYAVDMYRALLPHYRDHPQRLRLSIHDGIGHQLTRPMIAETCDWFVRFLK